MTTRITWTPASRTQTMFTPWSLKRITRSSHPDPRRGKVQTLHTAPQEQQTNKKQNCTNKNLPAVVKEEEEEPVRKLSRDSSSPDLDVGRDSEPGQTDHEYSSGVGGKQAGGPQPMAPGVFLTQRLPSTFSSSLNNNNNTAKGERGAAGAGGAGKGDAKSDAKRLKKGMVTAKQRLGKILKIQRNGKLLL